MPSNVPFFFELFDFSDEIKLVAQAMKESLGLATGSYSVIHYRGGDFRNRKERSDMYSDFRIQFQKVKQLISSLSNHADNPIFIMSSERLPLTTDYVTISSERVQQLLAERNRDLSRPLSAAPVEYIHILVDIVIAAEGSLFVGHPYSTLSELVILYAELTKRDYPHYWI